MKGNTLRKRLVVLATAATLLMAAAVPAYAAPGGVPGPPPDHEVSHGNPHQDATTPDADGETSHVPDWAPAYGRRILDEFGVTYGHLQQCTDQSAATGDEATDIDDSPGNPNLTCPEEEVQFPEDAPGAKAFWLFFLLSKLVVNT
jgi:hypothetical protein